MTRTPTVVLHQRTQTELFRCRFEHLPRQGDLLTHKGTEYVVEETKHEIHTVDTCFVFLYVITYEEFLKEFPNGICEEQAPPETKQ